MDERIILRKEETQSKKGKRDTETQIEIMFNSVNVLEKEKIERENLRMRKNGIKSEKGWECE